MSFTQKHLDAVEAAIARGEKTVRYADRTVEYRTVEELQAAIREVRKSISQQASATGLWPGPTRQIRVTTSKGF